MTTNKIPTDEEIVQRGLLRRGGHLYFENLIWIAEQARAAGRAEGRKAGMEEAVEINHTYGHTRLEKGTIFKSDALRAADAIRDRIEKLRTQPSGSEDGAAAKQSSNARQEGEE